MATPNEIQVGRYNRFVQKLLSIKGHATTFLASPEVGFNLSLFHGVENRYLEGWDTFEHTDSPAAPTAGNALNFAFRNPTASNEIVVIESIEVDSIVAGDVANYVTLLFVPTTAVDQNTAIGGITNLDTRGRPGTALVITANSAAAAAYVGPVGIRRRWLPALGNIEFNPTGFWDMPLLPGSAYVVQLNQNAQSNNIQYRFRSRFLEDSERK